MKVKNYRIILPAILVEKVISIPHKPIGSNQLIYKTKGGILRNFCLPMPANNFQTSWEIIQEIFCEDCKDTKHMLCKLFVHGLQVKALNVIHVKINIQRDICKKMHKCKVINARDLAFDEKLQEKTPQ